ncbi:MAG: THUMP domain-containing protein [Polyangia bacterium]|jgi:putative N6-adenine-specific DNA methylase
MRFFVTCARGTEGALRRELVVQRIHAPRGATGGVSFDGTLEDGMKVCLWSRVAMRVLVEVGSFPASDADTLYAGTRAADFSRFLGSKTTLAVTATTHENPELHHSGFAALKVKDAVVDALRDRTGHRPNVDVKNPDVSLVLHLRGSDARLFVDLAGEPLHRRGYRVAMADAPLKESLAAAVLALGGVRAEQPFVDPMTGTGTLAIEHALASRNIAPGLRRVFGFERWADQSHLPVFARLKRAAQDARLARAPCPILARDVSTSAIQSARRNARAAGVDADIVFEVADVATLASREPPGTICLNPPYGERLPGPAPEQPLDQLYASIVRALDRMHGWRAVILCGNPLLAHAIRRKHEISHRLWNGPLEARLLVYRL